MANISVERIFDLLYEHKIQQKELAKALGISAGNITEWKKGRSAPSAGVLPKIADYFGVTTDYLLGKTDEKKPAAETGDEPNTLLDGFPLTQDEGRLLSQYRALNRQGKEYILQTLDMVVDRYKKDDTVSDVAAPNVG